MWSRLGKYRALLLLMTEYKIKIPFLPLSPEGSAFITPSTNERRINSIRFHRGYVLRLDFKHTLCHPPTTSTESTESTKSLFPKYRVIWEKRSKAEWKKVIPQPELQELEVISGCWKSYIQITLLPVPMGYPVMTASILWKPLTCPLPLVFLNTLNREGQKTEMPSFKKHLQPH